jgi:hypothetical protein
MNDTSMPTMFVLDVHNKMIAVATVEARAFCGGTFRRNYCEHASGDPVGIEKAR